MMGREGERPDVDRSWRADAACLGRTDLNWFPAQGDTVVEVRDVCTGCPVRRACLSATIVEERSYGELRWSVVGYRAVAAWLRRDIHAGRRTEEEALAWRGRPAPRRVNWSEERRERDRQYYRRKRAEAAAKRVAS